MDGICSSWLIRDRWKASTAVLEDYLLDHALHSLGIPSSLLIFPGEGHGLDKNPWHGKIKVREDMKWLEKYAGEAAGSGTPQEKAPM